MSSRLMIAGAGSGKTTFLINEALEIKDTPVLITTFTDANEESIRKHIIRINGYIPANITIQTWFSFLLQHGVKPYQSYVFDGDISGLLLVSQKSGLKYMTKRGPVYYSERESGYYISGSGQIYSDKIACFTERVNEKSGGLVIDRIKRIYPNIFIDEVQDLSGYDLELIRLLENAGCNLLLVGDPRQVTYHTHEEAKNKKYNDGRISEYVKEKCKTIEIDDTTLNVSYRNPQQICDLANQLYPDMIPCQSKGLPGNSHHIGVYLVKSNDVETYLKAYNPVQLRDSIRKAVNPEYSVMNYGNSKGLTMEHVLIYPTKPIMSWLKDRSKALEGQSRAKLYVAITRARFSVAFIDDSKRGCKIPDIPVWVPSE